MPNIEKIAKYQAAIFIAKPDFYLSKKIINEINSKFSELYHFSLLPIETPTDAPPNIPRLFFTNNNQTWQCILNLKRCDLNYFPQKALENEEDVVILGDFKQRALEIFQEIIPLFELETNRLAFINELIGNITPDEGKSPVDYVVNKYLNPQIDENLIKDIENSEVHLYQRTSISSEQNTFQVNKIIRIKSIKFLTNQEKRLLFEIDINTIHDNPDLRYDINQMIDFFNITLSEIRNTEGMLIK